MLDRLTTLGRCLLALLLLYWTALFVGTHIPNLAAPGAVSVNDKTLHFLGYAGLTFLAAAFAFRQNRASRRRLLLLLAAVAAYGVLDELLQIPIPGRRGEFGDWVADVLGALAGAGLYFALLGVGRRLVGVCHGVPLKSVNARATEVGKAPNV